jgi:hypothetical protein
LKSGQTKPISHHFAGAQFLCKLPGGQIYFDSKLDLDSDGSPFAKQDRTGQAETSLRYPGGRSVDANAVPYFVLPGGFYAQHGVRLGDVATILNKGMMAFAVFADVGPHGKIGEGSIALHRALGHETIHNGKLRDVGIDRGVVTIVFPGSGDGTPQTPDRISSRGRGLFALLANPR